MVRGDPRCERFCNMCKADCTCQSCTSCHNCRDNRMFGRNRNSGVLHGCTSFNHDCIVFLKEVKEKEEKEKEMEMRNKIKEEERSKLGQRITGFPKLFNSDIIEIMLGKAPSSETRVVPKSLLIKNSEYFKRLFSFEEKTEVSSTSTAMDTEADRPEAFDCFIQYIYLGDYYTDNFAEEKDKEIASHADIYVLAERLQALPLKELALRNASKAAVDFVTRYSQGTTSFNETQSDLGTFIVDVLTHVYSNTPPASEAGPAETAILDPLRYLMAAVCACLIEPLKGLEAFNEDCIRGFPDFAVDLVAQLSSRAGLALDGEGCLKRN